MILKEAKCKPVGATSNVNTSIGSQITEEWMNGDFLSAILI
jgi:hypothetical protein